MKVVADASPIIFLSKLNALDLLPRCFDKIEIPPSVKRELGELAIPPFVSTTPISSSSVRFVSRAVGALHEGELEAMMLARETGADYILLDDLAARKQAIRLGLSVLGTIGVIALANAQKHLSAQLANQYYEALVEDHGLFISENVLQQVKVKIR